MQPDTTIRRINGIPNEDEVQAIIKLIMAAFAEDAASRASTGTSADDPTALPRARISAAGSAGGHIYVAEHRDAGIVGLAMWFGPGHSLWATEEQRALGYDQYFEMSASPERKKWFLEYFMPTYQKFTDDTFNGPEYKHNSWHLQQLAVHPSFHGQGIGKALVKTIEAKAREKGENMTLEATEKHNVAIYKRLGFTVRGEITIKGMQGEFHAWSMAKETATTKSIMA